MDREKMLFCVIWGLNFLISILCFLWKAKENKTTWRMRLAVMVLCPVIGPLFFCVQSACLSNDFSAGGRFGRCDFQ